MTDQAAIMEIINSAANAAAANHALVELRALRESVERLCEIHEGAIAELSRQLLECRAHIQALEAEKCGLVVTMQ